MDNHIVILFLLSAGISLFISFGRWLSSKWSNDIFDHADELFGSGSPSKVFAEIDPDESLSAAFQAALAAPKKSTMSTPSSFDDAGRNGRFYELASRVPCQFCGQPGELMTVCPHCGGSVG